MMEDIVRTIDNLAHTFQERLQARTVYGEPISANGVTVVPVAQVRFGFGGGGGGGTGSDTDEAGAPKEGSGGGGGGGGGGQVTPLGFIEISEGGARWVPIEPPRAELALRALTAAALVVPGGGRKGFVARLLLVLAGQAAIAALMRPKMELPEGLRFGASEA